MHTSASLTPAPVSAPLAGLGTQHGYRFVGAAVELTSSFRVTAPAAHTRAWSLQLWACAAAPASAADLDGQLVAAVALPPLAEIADPVETFTVHTDAALPAGTADHALVLVLAAYAGTTFAAEIHDFAVYPRRESFPLPRFDGAVGYRFDADRVLVTTAAIANPQGAGHRSGTLAVELWALPAPYRGGAFSGQALAGIQLGTLAGQERWTALELDLCAQHPAATSHVVLMLREWNGVAFVTRDFVNFALPFVVEPAPSAAATVEPVATTAPAATAAGAKKGRKPAPKADAKAAVVPVNTATEAELASVTGLPRPVAKAIVAARPFNALDELVEVKGFGPKLLAKVRACLRLN